MSAGIRLLIAAVTLGLATGVTYAQSSKDVPRIGILGLDRPPLSPEFLQSLRELGYVEGQNIVLEPRFHNGDDRLLPSFAAELVRLRVNVIVAVSGVAVRAAMAATSNVPIVGTFASDPEARQLVRNLERPVGNVTGIYLLTSQFGGKWLELITEAVPKTRRVAVLWTRDSEDEMPLRDGVQRAARVLGIELVSLEIGGLYWFMTGPSRVPPGQPGQHVPFGQRCYFNRCVERLNLEGAFDLMRGRATHADSWTSSADAFIALPALLFRRNVDELADLARANRLPGIFWPAEFAEAGGLIAYGPNLSEVYRRQAFLVGRLLKGAKLSELPVEPARRFELTVNLRTAHALGISVAPSVLAWADRVIR
jgi:putative ABC transport system substrate-binding protein